MQRIFVEKNINQLVGFFAITLMFFLPISTSIKSILLISCLIAILCNPNNYQYLAQTFNTLWARAACALFVFALMAMFWSPAPLNMQMSVMEKYLKLLYLPILAVAFINPNIRRWGLNSFLFAVAFTAVISVLKSEGLHLAGHLQDQGEIFNNHIVTGVVIAFGSYLSCYFFFQNQGKLRLLYLLLFLLTSYQLLFINTGRTGYLIYVVLMVLFLLQQMSLKRAMISILLFCAVLALSYTQSTTMQERVNSIWTELNLLKQNKLDTSLGYRVQFHGYAKQLFSEHPIKGQGTGGFKYRFSEDLPVPSWGNTLNEPHSQYWMTLAETGLIGLVLLIVFLASLLITAFKLKENRPILLGFLLVFCLVCFSDTVFCYSVLGYLLILIAALSLGELYEVTEQ